jgi:hypothetical protein
MSKILNKRKSLELFLQSQTLGPGINGYRFIDIEDMFIMNKNLLIEEPLNYTSEIIDIVPAAVYSTGILFPEDKSGTGKEGLLLDNNEIKSKIDDLDEEDSQDNSNEDVETTDSIELNQMFPRTMGLTCCLHDTILNNKDLEFKINFRYYKKIKQDKDGMFNNRYGLLCEIDYQIIQDFINKYNLNSFRIKTINTNHILILSKISSDDITLLKSKIRDIQKQIAESLFDETSSIYSLSNLKKSSCFLSNLKSTLFYELKNNITDDIIRKNIYSISQKIELVENITEHLKNLLDIFSGGFGLYQSSYIERVIRIENITFPSTSKKISFLHNKPHNDAIISILVENKWIKSNLKDIFKYTLDEKKDDYASLSANIQLSKDSRQDNNKIFLKIQLINTSTPFDASKQDDNRYYSTFNELVNKKSFFGVKISIDNEFLVPYSNHKYQSNNDKIFSEDTTTHFIYDQYKDFAIGHGCSVKWFINDKSVKVETEYLPQCETPDIDPIPRDKTKSAIVDDKYGFVSPLFLKDSKSQEFKWLSIFSDASDEDIIKGLNDFVDSYGNWIISKRNNSKYQKEYFEIAKQELDKCEDDYKRMKKNINDFFINDINKDKLHSFRLMNASMFMQLWHSKNAKEDKVLQFMNDFNFTSFDNEFYKNLDDKLFSKNESASWRAFQLAFIILNLDGIFKLDDDPIWDKRNNWVDLVWFPTGGGKTEAYLGLISLTIINRRKQYKENGGGTAAIMRYTLRLLTMQQFQRATLMIMALELIRRWGYVQLGDEPINIGLWVGDNSLPNKNEDLIHEFDNLNNKKSNKIPFNHCPWCNSEIKGESREDTDTSSQIYNQNKVHLKCTNHKCSFSFGIGRLTKKRQDQGPLPLCLTDETIYQHPPALLFGTVDKFAQLAHKIDDTKDGINKDSRRIFGKGNWENGKPLNGYLPPDLIIQDELHLLLGPLGSAVALFESAIDQLCTRECGTRPKIISSTATTRNTQLQIAALFDRKVNLFPKPGVECDDSFFAFYKRKFQSIDSSSPDYISKRKYIGVLPTGRTQIWMQMRLTAIIMTHRAIFELKELAEKHPIEDNAYDNDFKVAMDYYHTTISYFNSLKEVGKTQSQIQSYILKELRRVFSRVIRPQKLMHPIYTYGPIQESELTGRLTGEDVKNELKNVEMKWDARKRFAHLMNVKDDEGREVAITQFGKIPPEFVVATNMISVGIDVSRFNTIIMNSMPRNTAEYIQASSRVARNDYGLVLTVHHPFRARDLSHYEKFIEFHEKMYSYVEPISITPFTQKAVERYMGLYLATIIRHKTRFINRDSASEISSISDTDLKKIILELTIYFEKRRERMKNYDTLISNLLKQENLDQIRKWITDAFNEWKAESNKHLADNKDFVFNNKKSKKDKVVEQLYVDIEEYEGNIHSKKWQVPMSLRVIEQEAAIKINQY